MAFETFCLDIPTDFLLHLPIKCSSFSKEKKPIFIQHIFLCNILCILHFVDCVKKQTSKNVMKNRQANQNIHKEINL